MKTMITAHSGSDGTPDNSMEFVEYALGCGAEALEVDVRVRADGSFFLSHDDSSDACPDLRQVFSLLEHRSKKINCDLKCAGMELGVLALARQYGVEDRLLLSGEVDPRLVKENEGIRARTLFNLNPFAGDMLKRFDRGLEPTEEDLQSIGAQCAEFGVSIINIPYGLCTDRFLRFFRDRGIGISAWTVGDEDVARRLFSAGIANVTTRKPAHLCAVREALE